MSFDWWRGRKVLVTGHTGFKGAWLCLLLQHRGAVVSGYSLPAPTDPSLFQLAGLSNSVATVQGDIRDLARVTAAVKESDPEVVLHMAAQPLVREGYRDPVGTYAVNVMGTVNLLEAVRSAGPGVRAVVVVTTDKCYQNNEWIWGYRESEPLGGHDPYSSSKACAELVTAAYRQSWLGNSATAVASARAGNVIGGGDWAGDRLIPDMIKAFTNREPVVIRSPQAIRPWQLVLEPLCGYLELAERLCNEGQKFAEAWNLGPSQDDARPVQWIVERLVDYWGGSARWELAQGEQPHEAHYLKLDASKAHARLGWRPRTDLDTALKWIVEWYQAWLRGEEMGKVSLQQIERFLALGT